LVKTIAFQTNKIGSTAAGVQVIQNFWKEKGIAGTELNFLDGSGLSPLNRVTTHAQVMVLEYAGRQSWFSSFYLSLPEFNDMKMKSGTIMGVKGFCGYHTSKEGRKYIFSFLVNNYNGSSSAIVNKMYKVLNELK
jgi:D-alanyl-D-alanine carboxypeptidase/D-alanyl-D-alanine-endopeptidase (penicillin-binding protein 4)